jgi:AcrR family transcriptional regulator
MLAAARQIARIEGWQAVTIRKVAESIGYSHPTLYEFFEDKQALLAELSRQGFLQLRDELHTARVGAAAPAAYPGAMALAYVTFAWQNQELYEVMHSLGGAQLDLTRMMPEGAAVIDEAREAFELWARDAGVTVANVTDAVLLLWSTLHGIAALTLTQQMPGGRTHAASLAVQAVEGLHARWLSRSSV